MLVNAKRTSKNFRSLLVKESRSGATRINLRIFSSPLPTTRDGHNSSLQPFLGTSKPLVGASAQISSALNTELASFTVMTENI